MPTYRVCPPGRARGTHKAQVRAMYGMQPTIASAMIGRKACKIAPPVWNYQPGRVTLVKVAKQA